MPHKSAADDYMEIATIDIANTTLLRLVARAGAGEETVLARGKLPMAKLVPSKAPPPKRWFGALRGKISIGPEFLAPTPDHELTPWE